MTKKKKERVAKAKTEKPKKKMKPVKIDGEINAEEIARIRSALRQVWQWTSIARRNCLARVKADKEMSYCEECFELVGKVYVDHIQVLGSPLAPDYLKRLYCSSADLQALCKPCHGKKTRDEREQVA